MSANSQSIISLPQVSRPTGSGVRQSSTLMSSSAAKVTLSIAAGAGVWLAPLNLSKNVHHALAIASFVILSWISEPFSHALTGLMGCYLFWAAGLAKFDTAFSGFSNDATWFALGALVLGAIASKSGLAARLAYELIRCLGTSYSRILLGLIAASLVLTLIVPSGVARMVILGTIGVGVLDIFSVEADTNIARGLFVILTYVTSIFDKMVIAGTSAILAQGLISQGAHVEVLYSRWLVAFLPCSLVTILVSWRLTLWLYPPEKTGPVGTEFIARRLKDLPSWDRTTTRSFIYLFIAIMLWSTDSWHHMPPALVELGVALCAIIPGVGVLDSGDLRKLNYRSVIFLASAVSFAAVLTVTGALDLLTKPFIAAISPLTSGVYGWTLVLYWGAFVYHIALGNDVSMLALSLPMLMRTAVSHHLDPLATGMLWTFASGGKLFLYQSPVLIVGYSFGFFRTRDLIKVGACLTLIGYLEIIMLVLYYWPHIGV